ncbi:MAG: site-specific integrase [Acidimicrobiia bacterium]|nr:site-specific integrase [Acidimicrobiia bacterium]
MNNARRGRIEKDEQRGTWGYVVDVDPDPETGKRKQRRRRGFKRERDAIDALNEVTREVADGTFVAPSKLTVAETIRRYIESQLEMAKIRPTTAENYGYLLATRIAPTLGNLLVQDLRPDHIDGLYGTLLARGGRGGRPLAASTVRLVHGLVSGTLSWAYRKGIVRQNVAARATVPAQVRSEKPTWTALQVEAFLTYVADDVDYALWHTAARSGMRRGELLALSWERVDLNGGTIDVRAGLVTVAREHVFGEPKSHLSVRTVPIDPTTCSILAAQRRELTARWLRLGVRPDPDLVFPDQNGQPRSPGSITKRFARRAATSGLPKTSLHGLRHARETALYDAGLPAHVVSAVMGHTPEMSLGRYTHVDEHSLARVRAVAP